jgi:hypothetical protein
LALLTRQSWLLALPAALYGAWHSGRWRHAALLVAGAAMTVSTVALYAPFGAYWEWNFTNSPGFVFAAAGVGTSLLRALGSVAGFVGFHVTAAACLWLLLRRRSPLRAANRDDRDVWLWLLSGLAAVAAGFRFFGHYWLQVLPPLVVLATPVAAEFAGRARGSRSSGLRPAVVAFALSRGRSTSARTERWPYVCHTTDEQRVRLVRIPKCSWRQTGCRGRWCTATVTGRSGRREDPAVTLELATPGAQLMPPTCAPRPLVLEPPRRPISLPALPACSPTVAACAPATSSSPPSTASRCGAR